jgi:26S proteasome regulatory subunit N5
MVSEAGLYAKYDRPGGIISFTKKQKESARLEDWSNQVTDLLRLVDSTCHLIEKENQLAIAAEKKSL